MKKMTKISNPQSLFFSDFYKKHSPNFIAILGYNKHVFKNC